MQHCAKGAGFAHRWIRQQRGAVSGWFRPPGGDFGGRTFLL